MHCKFNRTEKFYCVETIFLRRNNFKDGNGRSGRCAPLLGPKSTRCTEKVSSYTEVCDTWLNCIVVGVDNGVTVALPKKKTSKLSQIPHDSSSLLRAEMIPPNHYTWFAVDAYTCAYLRLT